MCEQNSFEQLGWNGSKKIGRDVKGPRESKNVCFCFVVFLLDESYLTMFDSHGNNLVDKERLMMLERR